MKSCSLRGEKDSEYIGVVLAVEPLLDEGILRYPYEPDKWIACHHHILHSKNLSFAVRGDIPSLGARWRKAAPLKPSAGG
jgi:hypothetical protein